ncbi:hypothetical protein [Pseudolysinimonas sp.]|uniref:hypothetical protein n=1 Tax=Pseudolysinimonas sp. TaxID=2680009 RepID=UPI003F7D5AB0
MTTSEMIQALSNHAAYMNSAGERGSRLSGDAADGITGHLVRLQALADVDDLLDQIEASRGEFDEDEDDFPDVPMDDVFAARDDAGDRLAAFKEALR